MKNLLLTLLIVLVSAIALQSQPTELDTTYRKFYVTALAGASSYFESPVAGVMFNIDITDNKYPLLLQWENGILATKDNFVYFFDLNIGKRAQKYDIGISPFSFINNGGNNFTPTMSLFATLRTTQKFSFKIKSSYYYSYTKPGSLGFTATLNYKLRQFKNL